LAKEKKWLDGLIVLYSESSRIPDSHSIVCNIEKIKPED